MDIEIAEPGKMSQTGSSLLRLIQNNSMPTLDLLVRESIQNSLDAADIENSNKYVEVRFETGTFVSKNLSRELNGITDKLNHRYVENSYKYLAIRDYNTVGLTGKIDYDDVQNNDYGNFIKLVYEISKPQQSEGAGGSWGLGKTVYFRVGMGLVLYYSRIINEAGRYESRLAATLVENEEDRNSLIPVYNGKNKRGIAWWGKTIRENITCPITDENEINRILGIFNILPYDEHETGTTIIIPYINEKELLKNNQYNYESENNNRYWLNDLETYLKISTQRWYNPRLNNTRYEYGKSLRVKINGKYIANSDMEPLFQIIQSLYIEATNNEKKGYLEENNLVSYCDDIKLRQQTKNSCVGRVAYTKVEKKDLKMLYPDNKKAPYVYLNLPIHSEENNKAIVCFVRQPGMIVSYNEIGPWVDGIAPSNSNEYIIGIFKLNSKNELIVENSNGMYLEEYVRKSENADHISWHDYSLGNNTLSIISKIQQHVRSKISKKFEKDNQSEVETSNSGFGKLFGDMFLPPENFGKKASPRTKKAKKNKTGTPMVEHRSSAFSIDYTRIRYTQNGMQIPMNLKIKKAFKSASIEMVIDSSNGTVSVKEWEEILKGASCSIESVKLLFSEVDGKETSDQLSLNEKRRTFENGALKIDLIFTERDTGYRLKIATNEEHTYELQLYFDIKIKDRKIKPVFNYSEKRGD